MCECTTCTNVSNSYNFGFIPKIKTFFSRKKGNSARYIYIYIFVCCVYILCLSCETLEFQAFSLKSLNQHLYFCALKDFFFRRRRIRNCFYSLNNFTLTGDKVISTQFNFFSSSFFPLQNACHYCSLCIFILQNVFFLCLVPSVFV